MYYSKIFGKTLKSLPKGLEAISHRFLVQGGFVDQLSAGIYSFLPLGWRVQQKLIQIIRGEMNLIGGQEVFLPTLQPKSVWLRSDRWDHMEPPLFKLEDIHQKEYALGPTHEEVITDLAGRYINSYKDLPLYLYQIQNKFRNEKRAASGLLRVREFMMKDLYSFHADEKDLDDFYKKAVEAYKKIFQRCGLVVKVVEASSGSIGGSVSHEFMMLCKTGEDKVVHCKDCEWAANLEKGEKEKCPVCGGKVKVEAAIENGHIFKLGTKYSEKLGAFFTDKKGVKKPLVMGCYGIGVGRLMASIVEACHDGKGIIWPEEVSPYQVHLLDLDRSEEGQRVYQSLENEGIEILWDDREEVSAGEKFNDADLIGIPMRLVVSKKTGEKVEWKRRDEEKTEVISIEEVIEKLKSLK